MVDEILVHFQTVFIDIQMEPVRFHIHHAIPLLEEDDIGSHFRAGCAFEGIIGQTDGTQQISPLCNVFPHSGILLVQSTLGSNESNDAAGTNLVQCPGKEVVMDQEVMLVVLLVRDLELTERNIADGSVKEAVRQIRLFKALHRNGGLLIQLLGDAAGDAVQFHTVKLGLRHAVREHTKEVAHTAGGLQNIAPLEVHVLHGPVDGTDYHRRRVKSRQRGFPGGCIFFFGQ